MTRKLIFLGLLWLTAGFCPAQDPHIDSLKAAMAHAETDSLRVTATISLGRYFRSRSLDSARYFYQQALDDSRKHGYHRGEIASQGNLGITYGIEGEYPQAIIYFEQALADARKYKIYDLVLLQYNSLGIVYKRLGDYSKSYDFYLQALTLADSLGDKREVAGNKYNIAVLHDLMGEPEQAKKLMREAMQNYFEVGVTQVNHIYNGLGVIHAKADQYDSALFYYQKALELDRKFNQKEGEITVLNNIGNIYRRTGELEKAERSLKEALREANTLRFNEIKASILYNLSRNYIATHQLDSAFKYADQNLRTAKALGGFEPILGAYEVLSEVYEEKKDFAAALENYRSYKAYTDSLFNENKTKEFKTQQTKFDVYKKDQELAQQQSELQHLNEKAVLDQRWRYTLIAASGLLLLTLILLYQRYQHRIRHNELLKSKNTTILAQKKKIEEMNLMLERRMLRAQMNPHFIFNSLSSIQHFVTINDKASALRYLTKFSSLLRSVLETSANVQVTLAEEIKLIKIYLELEALRFDDQFKYDIAVDPQLDIHTAEIPLLLVQPYIENAILHGLLPSEKEIKQLMISFKQTEMALVITIEDNGIGRTAAQALKEKKGNKKQSLGMTVTEKRLQMFKNGEGSTAAIKITDLYGEDVPAGTRVTINIPQTLNEAS